jgi:hypothetical protein
LSQDTTHYGTRNQEEEDHISTVQPEDDAISAKQRPENKSSSSERSRISTRYPWTMAHSYYAVMGGYAFDDSDSDEKFMPDDVPRAALTPSRLLKLIDCGLISLLPNLSESQIRDKSKASGLAKTLVCIQATWFCVQCIFRLSQSLTICLLELNTFAHALCALLIYTLWWNKPLDVEEPSLLSGEDKDKYAAVEILRMEDRSTILLRLDSSLNNQPKKSVLVGQFHFDATRLGQYPSTSSSKPIIIRNGESIHGWVYGGIGLVTTKRIWPQRGKHHSHSADEVHLKLTPKLLRRLELAANAEALRTSLGTKKDVAPARIQNWPSTDFSHLLEIFPENVQLLAGFTMAGLVYGALHLCAWNAFFATKAQLDLWHMSSIVLTTSGAIVVLIGRVYDGLDNLEIWIDSIVRRAAWGFGREITFEPLFALVFFVIFLFALLYVFARVYLVVECFLSLAHLPPSAVQVPSWSPYIPHIA